MSGTILVDTLLHKRSSTPNHTPSVSSIQLGEIAINTNDGKAFIKKNDGSESIVEIGTGLKVYDLDATTTGSGITLTYTVTGSTDLASIATPIEGEFALVTNDVDPNLNGTWQYGIYSVAGVDITIQTVNWYFISPLNLSNQPYSIGSNGEDVVKIIGNSVSGSTSAYSAFLICDPNISTVPDRKQIKVIGDRNGNCWNYIVQGGFTHSINHDFAGKFMAYGINFANIYDFRHTVEFTRFYKDNIDKHWYTSGGVGLILAKPSNDGWGNEAQQNSNGYLVRYSLSQNEYNSTFVNDIAWDRIDKSSTIYELDATTTGSGITLTYTVTGSTDLVSIVSPIEGEFALVTNDVNPEINGTWQYGIYSVTGVDITIQTLDWYFISPLNLSNQPYSIGSNGEDVVKIIGNAVIGSTSVYSAFLICDDNISNTIVPDRKRIEVLGDRLGNCANYVILGTFTNDPDHTFNYKVTAYGLSSARIYNQRHSVEFTRFYKDINNVRWYISGGIGLITALPTNEDGWGNIAVEDSTGRLARYSLSEAEYNNAISQSITWDRIDKTGATTLDIPNVYDITYSSLIINIGISGLSTGTYYRITDYQTNRMIIGSSLPDFHLGVNEPLIVLAVANNKLSSVAYSELFPNDIIHYTVDKPPELDTNNYGPISFHFGTIFYRKDVKLNLSTYYDFRNVKMKRWNSIATPLIYDKISDVDFTNDFQDLDTFNNDNYNINVGGNLVTTIDNSSRGYLITNNVFGTLCHDITLDTINNTFGSGCYDITIKSSPFGGNTFSSNCYDIHIDIYSMNNSFNTGCARINIGNECENNKFGSNCFGITLGGVCNDNIFGSSNTSINFEYACQRNILGDNCNNIFLDALCMDNTFGNDCTKNSYKERCITNISGSACSNITFGNDCSTNTFSNDINFINLANNCSSVSLGDFCNGINIRDLANTISFGASSQIIDIDMYSNYISGGTSCNNIQLKTGCNWISFGNDCASIFLDNNCTNLTFGNNNHDISLGKNFYGTNFNGLTYPDNTSDVYLQVADVYTSQIVSNITPTITTKYGNSNYFVDAFDTSVTVTLQDPSLSKFAHINIKKIDISSRSVVINGTIDGTSSIILTEPYQSVTLFCNGSSYYII